MAIRRLKAGWVPGAWGSGCRGASGDGRLRCTRERANNPLQPTSASVKEV